jgi:hypothetical protein
MGQVYQWWWRICREINVLSRFKYHMFYVLYPFMIYLPTPRRCNGSRDSSVGITTGYELDGRGSSPGMGKIAHFSTTSRQALGPTQPPNECVPWAISQGVNVPGREADHYLHLVPRSRMVELYLHFTVCLHGVVLN